MQNCILECLLNHEIMKLIVLGTNKKAQLSLTNPRDAKVCQKLLQFDVLTNVVADDTGLSTFV